MGNCSCKNITQGSVYDAMDSFELERPSLTGKIVTVVTQHDNEIPWSTHTERTVPCSERSERRVDRSERTVDSFSNGSDKRESEAQMEKRETQMLQIDMTGMVRNETINGFLLAADRIRSMAEKRADDTEPPSDTKAIKSDAGQ